MVFPVFGGFSHFFSQKVTNPQEKILKNRFFSIFSKNPVFRVREGPGEPGEAREMPGNAGERPGAPGRAPESSGELRRAPELTYFNLN